MYSFIVRLTIFVSTVTLACTGRSYRFPDPTTNSIYQSEQYRRAVEEHKNKLKKESEMVRITDELVAPIIANAYKVHKSDEELKLGFSYTTTKKAIESGKSLKDLDKDAYYEAYFSEYGIKASDLNSPQHKVFVTHVAEGSPMYNLGLRRGNVIIGLSSTGSKFYHAKDDKDFDKMIKKFRETPSPIFLQVLNDSSTTSIEATHSEMFSALFSFRIYESDEFGSYITDNRVINLSTRMFSDSTSTEAFQYALAHSVAHGILGHFDKMKSKKEKGQALGAIAGAVFDEFLPISVTSGVWKTTYFVGRSLGQSLGQGLAILAFHKKFEREADYIGMYLLANAGVETRNTHTICQKIMDEQDNPYNAIHPSYDERISILLNIHNEIQSKILNGELLTPEVSNGELLTPEVSNGELSNSKSKSRRKWKSKKPR